MRITYTIDPKGHVKSSVEGGNGTNCTLATQLAHIAIGGPDQSLKREYLPEHDEVPPLPNEIK